MSERRLAFSMLSALMTMMASTSAALGVLDVVRVDDDDGLGVVLEALEHADLGVGLKAGKHAARVVVVKELAAKLEVELAAELSDALADLLRLKGDVLVVVKADAHGGVLSVSRVRRTA